MDEYKQTHPFLLFDYINIIYFTHIFFQRVKTSDGIISSFSIDTELDCTHLLVFLGKKREKKLSFIFQTRKKKKIEIIILHDFSID
jgi:hypothetical protein